MLIYGILFLSDCLGKVRAGMSARDAEKTLINAALDQFAIPGDASFPLNQAFEPPASRQDAESLRQCVPLLGSSFSSIAGCLKLRIYPSFLLGISRKSDRSSLSDYTRGCTRGERDRQRYAARLT